MRNYFNYFTEIEQRFQQRRGTATLLSTLDWALIETWRDAGIPLEAVLRGIDEAFDKHDARAAKSSRRLRKVNGLAWAAQSVMQATEQMKDAAVGLATPQPERDTGFESARIAAYLHRNAAELRRAPLPEPAVAPVHAIAARLDSLAAELAAEHESTAPAPRTEDLERTLTVLEEKLLAALQLAVTEADMVTWREQAARELAPYRARMAGPQLRQVTEQFLHKRLLESSGLPRLSLFYMEHL